MLYAKHTEMSETEVFLFCFFREHTSYIMLHPKDTENVLS